MRRETRARRTPARRHRVSDPWRPPGASWPRAATLSSKCFKQLQENRSKSRCGRRRRSLSWEQHSNHPGAPMEQLTANRPLESASQEALAARAVSVTDLRKTYPGGVDAVRGISFDVAPGQVFGLL